MKTQNHGFWKWMRVAYVVVIVAGLAWNIVPRVLARYNTDLEVVTPVGMVDGKAAVEFFVANQNERQINVEGWWSGDGGENFERIEGSEVRMESSVEGKKGVFEWQVGSELVNQPVVVEIRTNGLLGKVVKARSGKFVLGEVEVAEDNMGGNRLTGLGVEVSSASGELVASVSGDLVNERKVGDTGLSWYSLARAASFGGLRADTRCIEGEVNNEKVEEELRRLVEEYPELMRLESIGESWRGRKIWAVTIGDDLDFEEREVTGLITGMIHGDEPVGGLMVMDVIRELVENYGEDMAVTRWVNQTRLVAVPVLNPDGACLQTRKNGRTLDRNTVGVDLNRNFPFLWGQGSVGENESSENYRGEQECSEKECSVYSDLVERVRPSWSLDYHDWGEYVEMPYTVPEVKNGQNEFLRRLADGVALNSEKPSGGVFGVGGNYPMAGSTIDWLFHDFGVAAFIVELGSDESLGMEKAEMVKIVESASGSWQYMMKRQGWGVVDLKVVDSESGEPVEAEVRFEGMGRPNNETWKTSSFTGRYQKILEPGNYKIELLAEGYKVGIVSVRVREGLELLDVVLEKS